jgi:deoxyribodipyrimidine photo-lyase
MAEPPIVVWFRNDLRLEDHPALASAAARAPVVALFVLDDLSPGPWRLGGAARWWLAGSLRSLSAQLAARGLKLLLRKGAAEDVVSDVARASGATAVYCSRAYEPWAREQDARTKARLDALGISLKRFPGALLVEPEALTTKTGGPYRVFTPFWRALSAGDVRRPIPAPKRLAAAELDLTGVTLEECALLPHKPDWAGGLRNTWSPGTDAARRHLDAFITARLGDYAEQRNRPDLPATSRLSPFLRHGEISPAACWHAAQARAEPESAGRETFLKEIVWREFSYHLLFHFPSMPEVPLRSEFAAFPWAHDPAGLSLWQQGRTGYPIVDAGMRQLWTTGWMHNRVRMIVASFLIKHLFIPWQTGAAWFWDTLVDADLASNSASWQWVAGCGADAAPYFRIFNPVKQGETFDPAGDYVRTWVAELARLPSPAIHAPWEAPPAELAAAGVRLGTDYPLPIVDHREARNRALAAFQQLR